MKRNLFFVIAACAAFLSLNISCTNPEASEVQEVIEVPVFSTAGGEVRYGTVIEISTTTKDATIYYSTKGFLYPTNYEKNGTIGNKFTVYDPCTVSAIAVKGSNTSKAVRYTFTIKEGSKEEYFVGEDLPLSWGSPSNAGTDVVANKENYLISHDTYTLSYNDTTHNPNWVAWHLSSEDIGSSDRSDAFRKDTSLPSAFYAVTESDYSYSTYGFDRGHMCPSADRTSTEVINKETFYMTNMVPQSAANNQKVWMNFEGYERSLAQQGKELYVFSGPLGKGGTSTKGTFEYIPLSSLSDDPGIVVPASTWKICLILDKDSGDINRINAGEAYVIAINVPNTETCLSDATAKGYSATNAWQNYITTVDEIETLTGFDFFSKLDESVQASLESVKYNQNK